MHRVEEVGKENDVGVSPELVKEFSARLQDGPEEVPGTSVSDLLFLLHRPTFAKVS